MAPLPALRRAMAAMPARAAAAAAAGVPASRAQAAADWASLTVKTAVPLMAAAAMAVAWRRVEAALALPPVRTEEAVDSAGSADLPLAAVFPMVTWRWSCRVGAAAGGPAEGAGEEEEGVAGAVRSRLAHWATLL